MDDDEDVMVVMAMMMGFVAFPLSRAALPLPPPRTKESLPGSGGADAVIRHFPVPAFSPSTSQAALSVGRWWWPVGIVSCLWGC